ncbi:MAG: hypothetical protein M3O31_14845 [Acidobacteriota bacterium]|nr:hypothetical protein [Acidobacteriota bacterium]
MLPENYTCPSCKCAACYAMHRKGIDWVMSLLGLRPARCLTCGRKFYAGYRLSEDGKYVDPSPRAKADRKRQAEEFDRAA